MRPVNKEILPSRELIPDIASGSFEHYYLQVRSKEGRLYTDEVVRNLPLVKRKDLFYTEWKLRGQSAKRLCIFLKNKNQPLKILEVGCGNGWLSNVVSAIPGTKVTGIDINKPELMQAKRVFKKNNLEFVQTDIRSADYQTHQFDIIIFAASIQYFSSLNDILNTAFARLRPGGEIHILDSFFYTPKQLYAARKRTDAYYESLGMPGFSAHYYHHLVNELNEFNPKLMYKPRWWKQWFNKQNPFPWYLVKK